MPKINLLPIKVRKAMFKKIKKSAPEKIPPGELKKLLEARRLARNQALVEGRVPSGGGDTLRQGTRIDGSPRRRGRELRAAVHTPPPENIPQFADFGNFGTTIGVFTLPDKKSRPNLQDRETLGGKYVGKRELSSEINRKTLEHEFVKRRLHKKGTYENRKELL